MNNEARNEALNVDRLAALIRELDGDHTMGAGSLADAIADSGYLSAIWVAACGDQIRKDANLISEMENAWVTPEGTKVLKLDAMEAIRTQSV